jgi:hypothetical protein
MASMQEVISDPNRRSQVVADAALVLDQEVADKSGISGLAIKGAFSVLKGLKPGVVPELIEGLLSEFAQAVDPVVARCPAGSDLRSYLTSHTNDVVQALLGVTDKRAQHTTHQTLLKLYQKLRPTAEKNVAAAVPRVAGLVGKYVTT